MKDIFPDRLSAGRALAEELACLAGRNDLIVLALPRGGVPVGYAVARGLGAPLDVLTVRKLGFPGNPELALGAIASGGVRKINRRLAHYVPDAEAYIEMQAAAESAELERREREYRRGRPAPDLLGKTGILVDDGLATGATMCVAVMAARQLEPARIIVAVPVGSPEAVERVQRLAEEVICLQCPDDFRSVGQFYENFAQTSDEEVTSLLAVAGEFPEEGRQGPA